MPRGRIVRRSFSGVRRSPGRLTEWFGLTFLSAEVALPANSFIIDSTFDADELAKRPFTITRVVGELAVLSDQNVAVEVPFGALGMIVVSEKAAATGATAVPDPVTNVDSDQWFMYMQWAAEGSASTNVGRPLQRYPFDSRAQRRVQDGENLAVVIANASAVDGAQYVLNFRMLVKLS